MSPINALNFSVDGQLIGELGERLVTRNHVALSELIKNGYDADATSITVTFTTLRNTSGRRSSAIVVADNGQGMTFSEVKKNWMRIATANKQRNSTSRRFGRPRTGSKGIGRFSCQRLAQILILTTITPVENGFSKVKVTFDWAKFIPGSDLTEIPCSFEKISTIKGTSGTTLELIGLRDTWTDRDYNTLRRSVATLAFTQETSRPGYKPDSGLRIHLEGSGFPSGSGNLFENIIEAGWGRMRGSIDQSGCMILSLRGKYLEANNKYKSKPLYKDFAGMTFDVSYYVAQESYTMNRDTKLLTKSVLNELRSETGVRVYFERFRVFSLGESGDDWLHLDRDYAARKSSIGYDVLKEIGSSLGLKGRNVALVRPRNENLVGRVFLSKQHEKSLQIKMNREGFVESEGFRNLTGLMRFAIEWMGTHYAHAKDTFAINERHDAEQAFEQSLPSMVDKDSRSDTPAIKKAIDFLSKAASATPPLEGSQPSRISESIDQAKRVIELSYRDQDTEISILRTLASTAPLLFTFSHEVHALIGRLDTHASVIDVIASGINNEKDRNRLLEMVQDLNNTSAQFRQLSSLFGIIADTKSSARKRHYIRPLLDNLILGTKFTTDNSNIKVVPKCSKDLKTPRMRRAEFISIIINLYTNALKSTISGNGEKIEVRCSRENDTLKIEMFDTGVGLAKKYRENAFRPFISDPENKIYRKLEDRIGGTTVSSLGKGTGLGLSIVKGIVVSYKGKIEFFDPPNWSIGIRVTLPG